MSTKGKVSKPDTKTVKSAESEELIKYTEALETETRESRLREAIAFYKRRGTMEAFVGTLRDLTKKEKSEFFDDAMTRAKGGPPKRNPFLSFIFLLIPALLLGLSAESWSRPNNHTNYSNGFPNGVTLQNMPVLNTYTGNVWWVDSGAGGNGNPGTFKRPFATIDYAVGRCTADNGDIIMVKSGHAESVIAAGGLDLDVSGITIVGLGNGLDRPTITLSTVTTADIDVDAADVTLENVVVDMTGVDAIAAGIDVNAAGFNLLSTNIIMGVSPSQAVIGVTGDENADRLVIDNLKLNHDSTPGSDAAIFFSGAANDVRILSSKADGDFASATVMSASAVTDMTISDCILMNANNGDHAIEFSAAATGSINNTLLRTDAVATALDPGSLSVGADVMWDADASADTVASPPILGTSGVGTLGGVNDTTTDSVNGKIGTDTEMADTSLYDMITNGAFGTVNATTTDGIHGKIGTDTEMADSSLADVLWATGGIAAFPAAAAPANGVSMAEVLRMIAQAAAPNNDHENYIALSVDLTSATWNTQTTHEIATVTGAVRLRVLVECTEALTGAGATIELGTANNTAEIIAQTTGTDIDATEIWKDATPDVEAVAGNAGITDTIVVGGTDVGYTVGTAALTDGTLIFHMWWSPLDSTGAVTVGAGGAL